MAARVALYYTPSTRFAACRDASGITTLPEQTMRHEPILGHDEVIAGVEAIREELAIRQRTAVIVVADAHGEPIALLRLDGAPLSSIAVASNKAFTAARLRRPTRELGATLRDRGIDIAFYGDSRYVGFGGGLPVRIDDVVVGAVAVSGLSEAEDEELAAVGVATIAAAVATGTADRARRHRG